MKHFYIAASKIAGLGIMAGEDIKRGELIKYIKGDIKFKINKTTEDIFGNPNWIGIAKNQWIDPEKPYKFLNHSCAPTSGIKGKVALVAIKDIKEGQEITIDYSIIEADTRWSMKCACGEQSCRGDIKSMQFLPKSTFDKYMPYIPHYFQKLYKQEISTDEIL